MLTTALTQEEFDVAQTARDLISDPKRWTTDTSARDRRGHSVGATQSDAAQWCADGAIQFAVWKTMREAERPIFHGMATVAVATRNRIMEALGEAADKRCWTGPVVHINDNMGYAAILALFDDVLAQRPAPTPAPPVRELCYA